jgi:hypothetical protein
MNLNEVIEELTQIRNESPNVGSFEVICAEEEHFYGISKIEVDLEMAEVKIT